MGLIRNILGGDDSSSSSNRQGLHNRLSSDKAQPSAPPVREAAHMATPHEVAAALELVTGAVTDLMMATGQLDKKGGVVAAAKTGLSSDATWSEAGKTLTHDGRYDAKDLVQSAYDKYEAASELVDGMPEIEVPNIKTSRAREKAELIAGPMGATAVQVAGAGAGLALTVLTSVPGVGLIKRAVKKRRTKKAVRGTGEMLQEYEAVRLQLDALHRQGAGGCL